jgi:phenylpyruvate tautomerase PptA (4-oxalocrotonate tautomerase family)
MFRDKGVGTMPYIQIDLDRRLYDEQRDAISDAIHSAQVELPELGIPQSDKFQIFRPREAGETVFDPTYGGVDRQNLIVIQITLVRRHPLSQKKDLFANIVRKLGELGIRPEDILIALTENGFEDWKLGEQTAEAKRILSETA